MTAPVHAIREDVPCATCGYNLRGLPPAGKCPECGDSIRISLRLRWMGEPINRLRHQQGLAMQVTAISLLVLCLLPLVGVASLVLRFDVPEWLYRLALLLVSGAIAVAIFLGTKPVEGVTRFSLRWPARLSALAAVAILLVLNTKPLHKALANWSEEMSWWNMLCSVGIGALALWMIEVMPSTQSLDATPHHFARGLGFGTLAVLGVFFIISLYPGVERAGCVSVALTFIASWMSAAFFWYVGREFWS